MAVVVPNAGIKLFLDRGCNLDAAASYTPVSLLRVGRDQTEPAITDTALDSPLPIITNNVEDVDDCEVADWTEGTDSAGETLNSSSYKEGSYSLNLGKTGTTGTTFSYSKTTTSRDFTSKNLFVWVYITTLADLVASGTAITVRFGSDSSNYYYQDFDISSLAAGWNLLEMSQASPTGTTGTPTVAACDYSAIIFNVDLAADTVTLGTVRMDYWHVASSDDYNESFVSGYPLGPGDDLQVELRAEILDTEMNGFQISGAGFFNSDATPVPVLLAKHITIGKDSSEQIIYVGKIRGRQTT